MQLRVSERSFNGPLMEVRTLDTDEMTDWLAYAHTYRHTHLTDESSGGGLRTEGLAESGPPEGFQIEIQANSTCDD